MSWFIGTANNRPQSTFINLQIFFSEICKIFSKFQIRSFKNLLFKKVLYMRNSDNWYKHQNWMVSLWVKTTHSVYILRLLNSQKIFCEFDLVANDIKLETSSLGKRKLQWALYGSFPKKPDFGSARGLPFKAIQKTAVPSPFIQSIPEISDFTKAICCWLDSIKCFTYFSKSILTQFSDLYKCFYFCAWILYRFFLIWEFVLNFFLFNYNQFKLVMLYLLFYLCHVC